MAPPAKKRRTEAAASKTAASEEPEIAAAQPNAGAEDGQSPEEKADNEGSAETAEDHSTSESGPSKAQDRMARFKALQARAKNSSETNLKEATLESHRLSVDPSKLTALNRKHAIASHKLLKADAEEAGEDFERKRAWDWTIDESEKWDKRLKKKGANRDNNAFAYEAQDSNRAYKRQLQNINADMAKYDKHRTEAIEKAAASGGLDIVETEDGELIAIDKDGSFYSTADSTTFTSNKPDKAAVDKLVADMQRAEDQRMKKRRDRLGKADEGDVTFINEKNKQFNQKLARFYDKYTAEIRESFERGTKI